MASKISEQNIVDGQVINAEHITRITDALRGESNTDIVITGSLQVTGSLLAIGSSGVSASTYYGDGSNLTNITTTSASYATTSSYAVTSSYASTANTLLGSVTSASYAPVESAFSSSVASRLDIAGTGFWTASVGAINRQSDVNIIGDLDVAGNIEADNVLTVTGDANDSVINMGGSGIPRWVLGVSQEGPQTKDVFYIQPTRLGSNTGTEYFALSGGNNKITEYILSGSLIINGDWNTELASGITVYGESYLSGSITVPVNATVDGVDISAFSSSVASRIDVAATTAITASYAGTVTSASYAPVEPAFSESIESRITTVSSSFEQRFLSGSITSASYAPVEPPFSESYSSRVTTLEGVSAGEGRWTGSDGFISHFGDVQVTGSLDISISGSFDYLEIGGDTLVVDTIEVALTGSFGYLHVDGGTY